MKLEKQQLGIFAAIAVLIGVFAVLQYCPLRSSAHAMEKLKSAQISATSKTEEQIKNLPSLRTQLVQMQAEIGDYNRKIPNDRSLGVFLQEIADVMNKHNLGEQMVQPDSEVAVDGLMCIPVRMQCKGSLRQIFEFFRSLGAVERLIRIEQVQLKNDSDLSGTITMTAKGNIYYLKN
jgi:Tfp pilus assembly protein PilO